MQFNDDQPTQQSETSVRTSDAPAAETPRPTVSATHIAQAEGEVKWFDPRKGYGFIVGPEGQDIFAHYSVIEGDGFRVLRDGAKVRYDAECTGQRWKATRVERVAEQVEGEIEVVRGRAFSRSPRR